MKIKGTIVITDPCYIKRAFPRMKRNTIYGDWSCMVYTGDMESNKLNGQWDEYYFKFFNEYNFSGKEPDEKKKMSEEFKEFKHKWLKDNCLGEFCADSGNVAIFSYDDLSLDEIDWINSHPWCATVIEDFDGDVDFIVGDNDDVHVVGKGNIDFFSTQSGF